MPEVYTAFENEDFFSSGYELQAMNTRGIYSPSSGSQETASVSSSMSVLSSLHDNELTDITVIGDPYITILEQPTEKFRFRYKSEMVGTHGSLVGSNRKNVPTVQLHNFLDPAVIRCTLVTSDEGLSRIPHAHKLIRRDGGQDYDDPHYITVSAETGYTAIFQGMAIIHTAKRHIRDELIKKMRLEALEKKKNTNIKAILNSREEAQIKVDADHYQKHMNLNSVALCFQAFVTNHCGVMIPITEPVYSQTINNLKSALTGELKICRMDKLTSSVEGGEEIFILVEKVGKKNIRIKFFELNEDGCEIWSAYGRFSELDVHHQYAIVFRTPPYKDQNITLPKNVFIQLERPSDGDCSDARKFTYKPSDRIIGRKRQRISYSGSSELSNILPNTNSIGNENISELLNNSNSHELSKEIKKILSEGTTTPVCKDFLSDIDVDNYLKLLLNSEENMLGTDGPSIVQYQDDVMFAKNILTEIMQCMKMDAKNMEEYIQKLLKDRSTYGDSPLHSALRYGQHNIVKYLLMLLCTNKDCKTLINSQNSSGKTPLHYAVLQNQPEITKALLMLGADPNRTDDHGFSPLHVAVKISDAGACVDVLLSEKGINIEAYNDAGWTALHLATKAGSYDAVCSLVHAGANVNNTDMSYGRTALHIAVEGGHKKIVEYLLKKTNISVNKRNFSGNTALHTAVVHTGTRAKELCALLIQHGADPYIQNHNRESNDVNKKKESHVNVKVEVHSEDENIEGAIGQSSFDLAMNKPDILQVFNGQSEKTTNKMCLVTTKLELKHEDLETNWLNNEHKEKLSILLDKTQGWQKLAKQLNIEYLLQTFQHNSISPSLGLLNYIDVEAILSLMDMQTVLREIGEEEAADYINEISSICS
ncbi:nuclear factor NF-kappa-B p105 subunit isoform X1 [Frieseomelitta varia]|uniref:nuclear factor NF-kappa-B p105 subunit isoform X1 n=2 Tax=Frieseomelitta varia TaxID=561572 RepID=UPI001CB6A19B|nr:nuclear factor NF-kappa-B p105 subunit isoform X1 [Frieseomelitta varia]XP_043507343.1 nuclear factor NF-kappa-B p105 subunit isoform X1 [Frieseomelitta varia]XP_043507344.1 nuclear factor NF-kappa-B p105 subunit isoform X1 [Frieseomelitta varia]